MALQPLYKGLGKEEFEGGKIKKRSLTPAPLRMERGVITDFATVIDGKNKILRTIKVIQL